MLIINDYLNPTLVQSILSSLDPAVLTLTQQDATFVKDPAQPFVTLLAKKSKNSETGARMMLLVIYRLSTMHRLSCEEPPSP